MKKSEFTASKSSDALMRDRRIGIVASVRGSLEIRRGEMCEGARATLGR